MGIFLPRNINYKDKPQQYGDFSFVQSSLFENADRIGIEPDKIVLALPMWEKTGTVLYNYANSKTQGLLTNTGSSATPHWGKDYIHYPFYYSDKARIKVLNGKDVPFLGTIIVGQYGFFSYIFYADTYHNLSLWRKGDHQYRYSKSSDIYVSKDITDEYMNVAGTWNDYNKTGNFYFNGQKQWTGTGLDHLDIADLQTNYNLYLGLTARDQASVPTNTYYALLFSILLKDSQIAFLSDNPYYLWQPRNKRTWFIPVDATGGNISSKAIIKFDIFQALSCNLISIFDIFKQLSCNKSLLFNIDNIVSESLISKFDIRKLLSFSCQINFDILGVNVSVNSNIQALFNIYKTTTRPFITKFDIHKLINSNTAIKFDINTQIVTELKSVFNIRKLTSLELIGLYDMAGKTSSEIICIFRINSNNQNGIFIINNKYPKIKFNDNHLTIGSNTF